MRSRKGAEILRRALGAVASGAMLAALFPKAGWWFLAWVALVPLIVAARASRPRAAAGWGLLAGFLFFGILLEWVRLFDATGWVILTLWQAGYVAAFAVLVRVLSPDARGWRALLVPAAAWAALEWLRSLGRAGFTWGGLAYALHGHLALLQLAAVLGPLGITFLIVLANAAVAALVAADRATVRAAALRLSLIAALILGISGWGCWRLLQPLPAGPMLRVALIQGNVSGEGRDDIWSLAKIREVVRTYAALTREAARSHPDLVIWPETAVPDYLNLNPEIHAALSGLAAELGVNLLVGGSRTEAGERYFNSAFLFARDGRLVGQYDKVQLVPFGEFTPWRRQLAFLYRYFPIRSMDYTSGRGFHPVAMGDVPIGAAICFESAFPRVARALRRNGAGVLVILTNDAWFERRAATWQHYQMAAFRAVESGSYLARVATTGFSAILDPRGRVVAETPLFARRNLTADVPAAAPPTPYLRLGDVVGWGSALAVGLLLFISREAARPKVPPLAR